MAICVEIEALPDGTYSVTECEPREEEEMPGEAESAGQTVASIDEALATAKALLDGGAPSLDPAAGAFETGFANARGGE